jgi:hypothetical protein
MSDDIAMKRVSMMDPETGERVKLWVELTPDELAQREADRTRAEADRLAREAQELAKLEARERLSYDGLARLYDDVDRATTVAALKAALLEVLERLEDIALALGIEDEAKPQR